MHMQAAARLVPARTARTVPCLPQKGLLYWSNFVPISITDNESAVTPYPVRSGDVFQRGALLCYKQTHRVQNINELVFEITVSKKRDTQHGRQGTKYLCHLEYFSNGLSCGVRLLGFESWDNTEHLYYLLRPSPCLAVSTESRWFQR